ncbi:helix-turn-helix domain-containing protein [Streptomyces sp. B-S-A8]|uniref:Helix-turn-helix domain-containing protein n=1 Tax=Streptomyces solicavernae TaxID=3043614 RepID=A0ABT6S2G8_9ACTN|nr:helix-turn-helix domain-containing protein [Streptomyces sp. B-S-A8]MDI3390203.1 helix-turn-helix domain-containing protein [Streptomyces sp. B-S-A8]
MSHDARTWVWDHSRSKGTARMVLALIADRCVDRQCIAYASVPALMKRANASRTAVRDALDKLVEGGELRRLVGRKGPRGETYYQLPDAARFLAERAVGGGRIPYPSGSESDPVEPVRRGAEYGPGERISTPGDSGFRHLGGADSDPQNSSEPKVNGKSSSTAADHLLAAADWQVDAAGERWLQESGHLARLGEDGLREADAKWRSYRATSAPRTADAWAADWRSWIGREHTPAPERPDLRVLPGTGDLVSGTSMSRAEAHQAALLAALEEPHGRE